MDVNHDTLLELLLPGGSYTPSRDTPPEKPLYVVVTGSRAWTDPAPIRCALLSGLLVLRTIAPGRQIVVAHGGAPGADTLAGCITRDYQCLDIVEHCIPADWDALGKAAGPIRNQALIDLKPVFVLAFPLGSGGTLDCMQRAHLAGIPVYVTSADGSIVQDKA